MKNIISLIAAVIFFFFYFKWFERRCIYYPTREIEFTPESISLRFEDVYFTTSDGIKLNGWFIPAANSETTLIFLHGNAGNISHRMGSIQIFNRLGLNVFIFDYRGYGKSNGRPYEEGTYLDAKAAYDYVARTKEVNRDKIILYGESLGGAIAYELATTARAGAVITLGTFSSIVDMGKVMYPFLPIKLIARTEYDTLSKVAVARIPKLFIHSADDEIIPIEQGRNLFSRACEPKEFYEMRGGHNDGIFTYESEFCEKVTSFLKRHDLK